MNFLTIFKDSFGITLEGLHIDLIPLSGGKSQEKDALIQVSQEEKVEMKMIMMMMMIRFESKVWLLACHFESHFWTNNFFLIFKSSSK